MQIPISLEPSTASGVPLHVPGADVRYYPRCLAAAEADTWLRLLLDGIPWRQDSLTFGGRRIPVPRLQAWFGDPHCRYAYSGLQLPPLPWTPPLLELRARVEAVAGRPFNSVLLNYYRDGRDSVSWHSDDEKELGPDPVVASLSLGAVRRFRMKHRSRTDLPSPAWELGHGSLLVMGHGSQTAWRHQLPKQPGVREARVNLTFRWVMAKDS